MTPRLLLRMAQWARTPPSAARVKLVALVIALCLGLLAVETWIGWPAAWQAQRPLAPRMLPSQPIPPSSEPQAAPGSPSLPRN